MLAPLVLLGTVRRHLLIRRRGLAALCAALAVWLGLDALTAEPPPGIPVITAAHDLPSGTTLASGDLRRTRFAAGSVPATALRTDDGAVGRTLLAPLARGEPVTSGRLLGRSRLVGYPGRSAVGLRIPDQDAAALLDPGDQVDLVASDPQGDDEAVRLVRGAVVLALPRPDPDAARVGIERGGRLVLFAVASEEVERVAAAASSHFLTLVWTR